MTVVLCSMFRNAVGYIDRYFEQVEGLANVLARGKPYHHLHLILGYGDSDDGTGEKLFEASAASIGAELVEVNHGGPDHGSVVDAQRFRQLAFVANSLWSRIPEGPGGLPDAAIWLESDLIWQPSTLASLIYRLGHYPAVAPMVMMGNLFYDVWAGRKNGVHFTNQPPYFDGWPAAEPVQVDSMGSCLAMRGDLARQVNFPEEDVIVGLCRQIYDRGGSVWLDPSLSVRHP